MPKITPRYTPTVHTVHATVANKQTHAKPIQTSIVFAWAPLANYGYLVPSRFRQNQSKSQGIGHILFDDYMMHEH